MPYHVFGVPRDMVIYTDNGPKESLKHVKYDIKYENADKGHLTKYFVY